MLDRRVTLREVAEAAKLSRSGVSRALHNDPRVPARTCERVQAIARGLGYRPDPELNSALRLLRQRHAERYVETLAFFTWHADRIERAGNLYTKRLFFGAREHTEKLGYRLEEVWAAEPGMTPARIKTVLAGRGIRGCLIGPVAGNVDAFDFDWPRFACVAVTASFPRVQLHRALPGNYGNTQLAIAEVAKVGYQRPGLLLDDYINARTSGSIQAAFLQSQANRPDDERVPVLELRNLGADPGVESAQSGEWTRFADWYQQHRPDVILASRVSFHHWLQRARLRTPRDVGFVSLEGVNADEPFTHIDQNPDAVGAAGVDLLTTVLNHNDRNILSRRLTVTVGGRWVAGSSTSPLAVTRARRSSSGISRATPPGRR